MPTHARRSSILALGVVASALPGATARGQESPQAAWIPHANQQKLVTPDARRFLPPPSLAYWAGTERVAIGELSIATPRPFEGAGFLPALDDHLSTTSYVRAATSVALHGDDANVVELSSLHDIRGGAVLGVSFRVDARAQTAVQGSAIVAVPLPARFWIVPTIGVGADARFAPQVLGGTELRSDRDKPVGYSFGVEASSWSDDRARILGSVGGVYRVARSVALEEHVAIGAWTGPRVGGDVAMRWISAALQTLGKRTALYERVTLARGPAASVGAAPADHSAFSADVAVGVRRTLVSSYGVIVQLDEGGQQGTYQRWGAELTLYGMLF